MLKKPYRLCVLLPLLFFVEAKAQSINARFSTSLYSWQRQLADTSQTDPGASESLTHLRAYQTAQLTIGQLASNRLSVHFYGQASGDLASSAEDDVIPRIYNFYAQWREGKGILEQIRIGRQRSYAGVAYGSVDGIDLTLRFGRLFKLGGYVGMLVPFSNKIEVGNWDDSRAYGLRLSTTSLWQTKIMISYMQRDRRPEAYSEPGRYTQQLLEFQSLEQRLIGADVYRRFGNRVSLYGRFDYDLEQDRVRRGQVELSVRPADRLNLTAEFFHRAPLVEANSIFWVFQNSTTQDIGLRAAYEISAGWFINGNFGYTSYEGDESVRFGAGIQTKYGSFGYNYRRGYGGFNNGFYAAANYPLNDKLGLLGSVGLSRYNLYDVEAIPGGFNPDENEYTSLTGSLGINFRPNRTFSFDLLGQGLHNRFYDNDLRFFVKANYWFFSAKSN